MSGRKTGKNSSCYEIEQRRRRASVEAIVQSAKPEPTTLCQPAVPIGPPIQKRMLTINQEASDRSLQNAQVLDREGPKARAYTPRYEGANADPREFPCNESEREFKTYECKRRFMEMLVSTDPFDWRPEADEPEDQDYGIDETERYQFRSPPLQRTEKSPSYKYLKDMCIELREKEVPSDRIYHGHVFLDLEEPATVESVEIDINQTCVGTDANGKVTFVKLTPDGKNNALKLKLLPNRQPKLLLPGTEPQPGESTAGKSLPKEFALIETIPKKVILQPGTNAIPFEIYVPEDQVPTFTYTSLKGQSVYNYYSAGALVRLNGNNERTGRVAIVVPALGGKNVGYSDTKDNYEFVLSNKYFTKDDGFGYTVGYEEGEKPKNVKAQVVQLVKCREIGLNEETPVADLGDASRADGKSNPVLDKYRQNPDNKSVKDEWDGSYYDENIVINPTTPTVQAGGFTCDYRLELKVGEKTYEGPVILVDHYDDKEPKRPDLSNISKRKDFKPSEWTERSGSS
ncbi:unnamed protein product [Taenia asiatica]|uniref:Calponin-homology (CH) domain-containing protein n=1 Tax=Taenia asiatica TaxID=60517 RepID=A0A0R3W894_TAEAS|nr:unnamed protein product [Taenia asiatica]